MLPLFSIWKIIELYDNMQCLRIPVDIIYGQRLRVLGDGPRPQVDSELGLASISIINTVITMWKGYFMAICDPWRWCPVPIIPHRCEIDAYRKDEE